MKNTEKKGSNTKCVHAGELHDTQFNGAVSPLFPSTSYSFLDNDLKRYPRNFNTPNQLALAEKIATLEHAEAALLFGSGMAAISTSMFAFLEQGNHVLLQKNLYGGTFHFVTQQLEKFGISYTLTEDLSETGFRKHLKENTKVIYIETPSNPLLTIIDVAMIGKIGKEKGIVTMIDNTFASPINQNPILLGIDVVIHSATKYMGGHSDILAGAVAASEAHIKKIAAVGKNFGGNLSDYTVWLLERSVKTMGVRVKTQNRNAKKIAKFLSKHPQVGKVYYPGLKSHPGHEIAKSQMKGYGGMLSFELKNQEDAHQFMLNLKMIKPSMSLAGVESTVLSPTMTSHFLIGEAERKAQGISDGLIRFSVGIEDKNDIIADLEQAFSQLV